MNSLSVKLFISVSLVVFQWFSISLSIGTNSLVFSFCLTFPVSVKLGEIASYYSLERVSLCWSMPSGFGGRAGSNMNTSHIFPQGVLAAIIWCEVRLEMEGLQPEPSVSQGFSSAQRMSPPYGG